MPNPYYNNSYPNYYNPYSMVPNYVYRPQVQTWSPNQASTFYQQPNSSPDTSYPQQVGAIKWVYSEKEVEDEYVAPNGAITLWNANEPVIYLKQADATGKPSIKIYDLVERTANDKPNSSSSEYATSEDLSTLSNVVKQMSDNFATVVNSFKDMKSDIDRMKDDMYGIAGKKKIVRKAEVEEDA